MDENVTRKRLFVGGGLLLYIIIVPVLFFAWKMASFFGAIMTPGEWYGVLPSHGYSVKLDAGQTSEVFTYHAGSGHIYCLYWDSPDGVDAVSFKFKTHRSNSARQKSIAAGLDYIRPARNPNIIFGHRHDKFLELYAVGNQDTTAKIWMRYIGSSQKCSFRGNQIVDVR